MKIIIFFVMICFGCSYQSNMSISEACSWVNQNIEYKSDVENDWKHPLKTLEDRNGDCEDQAMLVLYLCQDAEAMLSIVKYGNGLHAVARKGCYFYDGTSGKKYHKSKWKITKEYTLTQAEAMSIFY